MSRRRRAVSSQAAPRRPCVLAQWPTEVERRGPFRSWMPRPPSESGAVSRPAWVLRRKYRVRTCTPYTRPGRTLGGVLVTVRYNYVVEEDVGGRWKVVKTFPGGKRGLLQLHLKVRGGDRPKRKVYLHRIAMFNLEDRNPGRRSHTVGNHVHHTSTSRGRLAPWAHSCLDNMVIWDSAAHRAWHEGEGRRLGVASWWTDEARWRR